MLAQSQLSEGTSSRLGRTGHGTGGRLELTAAVCSSAASRLRPSLSMTGTSSPFAVPPSKPTVSIPSSATIGSRAVLTCSEQDGSPPSEYYWFRDGILMPTEPKSSRAFSNSSYTLNHKTGELVWMGNVGGRDTEPLRVGVEHATG